MQLNVRMMSSSVIPGATTRRSAVHWPLFSIVADTRIASLTAGVSFEVATRVLGPPVEEIVFE